MTKAETIFKNIRREALYIIRTWGLEESKERNFACKFDLEGTKGFISQRTVNDVQKQLDKYIANVERYHKFGIIGDDKLAKETEIIRLVRTAIVHGQEEVDYFKALARG